MSASPTVSENNKRIAKNTLMLYVKMAFTMGVGIYTTRVLLEALGVNDYGLVTVIGGVVTMFAFLSGTMSAASSRFFNFELGQKNFIRLKQTFNLTQLIYAGLVIILLLLSETVGLWFLENKVVIPPERMDAAFWFFQFSVFTFLLNTLSIPYSALIVSHENIKAFAWIAIFESVARLGIVYLLSLSSYDKLAFYGALLMSVGVIHFTLNYLVCRFNYKESRLALFWEKRRFIELITFGGWNFLGVSASLFTNIFINILLNNCFGAAVSAARGVTQQVSTAITAFITNFLAATNPQIVKYYAAGDFAQSHLLTMRASRMGFFLMFFVALPAWLLMPFVLGLWLEEVPAHTLGFIRLTLVQVLIDAISVPLTTLAQATGRIALYQSVVGLIFFMTFPISWCMFHFGTFPPEAAFVAIIGTTILCLVARMLLVRRCAKFSVRSFFKNTILPIVLVASTALVVPTWLVFVAFTEQGWTQFFVVGFMCVCCSILAIFSLGLSSDERKGLLQLLRKSVLNRGKYS